MAGQSITFDFLTTGADRTASGFRKVGDNTVLAARGAKVLADAIEKLGSKEDRTAAESKILASALRQTGDAEDRVAARAVLADAAIRRLGDSMQDSSKKSSGLRKALGDLKVNPGLVGPILALAPALATLGGVAAGAAVGLGGAFIAGGGALAAFGAVAKPVLADAKKAAAAAETAQTAHAAAVAKVTGQYTYAMSVAKTKAQRDAAYAAEQKGFSAAGLTQTAALSKAYAGLSPAQVALSKQLGAMADAWDKVKAAQTPVVAGALQPWLRSITGLTAALGPIIAKVAPVIQALGVQFSNLVTSSAFRGFRDFIGSTGAAAVSAGGSTIIDLVKSFMILLPKFDPLIREATGWISRLGPAVLSWSSSKKASDDITRFLQWFSKNGPAVGGLIKSIGGALKALAPGLASGGALELKLITGFLNLIAKLPPAIAKPLAEVAGAALILSKMGVLKVGLQVVGPAVKWLTGGAIDIGGGASAAAAIRAAFTSGGAAAAAEIRAAMVSGGAVAAGEEGAAGTVAGKALGASAGGSLLSSITKGGIGVAIGLLISKPIIGALENKKNPKVLGNTSPNAPWNSFTSNQSLGGLAIRGIQSLFSSAAKTAAQATAQIVGDFARQGKAARSAQADIGTLTNAITHDGNASYAAHSARAALIADMTRAGVNATTAQADVVRYSNAVTANGAKSDQARAARQKLVSDILSASGNARQGNKDLSAYTTAVQAHGTKADAARGARQRLIQDLVNSGTDAKTASGLVDGLGASITKLPGGKTITITEKGLGSFAVSQTMTAANNPAFGISGRAAAGLYVAAGTTPTADDVLIRASRGELVVPANLVSAGAVDHLRGAIPGFAGGGVVPSYSGNVGGLGPWTTQNDAAFTDTMTAAMEKAMTAAVKTAMSSAAGQAGGGVQQWRPLVLQALQMEGLPAGLVNNVLYQMQTESGGNPRAINLTDINAQHGDPSRGLMQTIMGTFLRWHWPGTSFDIYDPLANIAAAINYSAHGRGFGSGAGQMGSGHGYAEGGLVGYAGGGLVGVPGYATGGTVAHQGQTYLNAWRSRRGSGAHGPTGVNEQIAAVRAAIGRAQVLSRARGLSASQHRFWAGAAAGETSRLAGLNREAGVERAWRGQLGTADAALTREIRAAGGLPSLAGPVRSWKAQLKAHQYTIGQINTMLNARGPAKAAGGEPAGLTALQISREGQTYLNAWRSRAGGGYGAAHGPQTLNQQIPAMAAAIGRAATLSRAPGLSAAQHRFWANAAADETKRLAVLRKEMTVEQGWRGQLAALNAGLARDITAAGGLPSLAGSVKSWKAQQAAHTYTIGQISGMVGLTAAQQATANLPKVTHVYGGDVANTIGATLASALGPFTGAAKGGLVSYDRGGWLPPGASMAWNGTGRPEQVLPARGGAGGRLQVEWVGGNGGDDLERWIRKNVRIRGGGDVQRAYGARLAVAALRAARSYATWQPMHLGT